MTYKKRKTLTTPPISFLHRFVLFYPLRSSALSKCVSLLLASPKELAPCSLSSRRTPVHPFWRYAHGLSLTSIEKLPFGRSILSFQYLINNTICSCRMILITSRAGTDSVRTYNLIEVLTTT